MWLKKKSVLIAEGHYNTEKSADGATDMRTTGKVYSNSSITNSEFPSAADASNYFYLPALGSYGSGQLGGVGRVGFYWSSSARPMISGYVPINSNINKLAYYLYFSGSSVGVSATLRNSGFSVGTFE